QSAPKTDAETDQAAQEGPTDIAAHQTFSGAEKQADPPGNAGKQEEVGEHELSPLRRSFDKKRFHEGPGQQGPQSGGDRQVEPTGIDDANDQRLRIDG